MRPAEADIGALLERLAEAGVERIVVGGVAALLDLPALISIKQSTGRVKDRMAVPVLTDLLRARSGG